MFQINQTWMEEIRANPQWQIIESESQSATNDPFSFSHLGKAFKAIEEYNALAGALISITGYIVISTFGQMNFVEYIWFLIIVFLFYNIKKTNLSSQFFMYGFFILLCSLFFIIIKIDMVTPYISKIEKVITKHLVIEKNISSQKEEKNK